MDNIISQARAGSKTAVSTLYSNNKNKIYSIAYCLLQDKQKAEKIVIDLFSGIWTKLEGMNIETEDGFISYCMSSVVSECQKAIVRTDSKAFQPPKNKNFIISTDDKATDWKNALLVFSPLQRFIFITRVLCKFSPEQIAKIVHVDVTTVKLVTASEKTNLDKIWSLEETEKGLLTEANSISFSPSDSSAILDSINKYIEPFEKNALSKKIKVLSVILTVCIMIAVVFSLVIIIDESRYTSGNNTSKADTSTQSDSSVQIDKWVTSVTATDYAVIDIKDYGTVSVALDGKTAPITVENFKKLANEGFYDGLTFHRIMEGFMMQGGDPKGNGTGGADKEIKGEFAENGVANNISHVRGAISMARSPAYDSASSQFFIVHKDSLFLNEKYAAFGFVVDGMDVVDKVCKDASPTDDNGTIPASKQPIINSVKIYSTQEFEEMNKTETSTNESSEASAESASTESTDETSKENNGEDITSESKESTDVTSESPNSK